MFDKGLLRTFLYAPCIILTERKIFFPILDIFKKNSRALMRIVSEYVNIYLFDALFKGFNPMS